MSTLVETYKKGIFTYAQFNKLKKLFKPKRAVEIREVISYGRNQSATRVTRGIITANNGNVLFVKTLNRMREEVIKTVQWVDVYTKHIDLRLIRRIGK